MNWRGLRNRLRREGWKEPESRLAIDVLLQGVADLRATNGVLAGDGFVAGEKPGAHSVRAVRDARAFFESGRWRWWCEAAGLEPWKFESVVEEFIGD